ncbi:MAG: DUF4214 domain-containing protein, partial [Pseudomonadota bacterium]
PFGGLDNLNDALGDLPSVPIEAPDFNDDPPAPVGDTLGGGDGGVDGSDTPGSPSTPLDDGLGDGLSEEAAREVAYLYEAGLNRNGVIDLPGLNFWIDQREDGLSEHGLAQAFLGSGEFAAAFGDPNKLSDEELVAVLYRNVLDREGEASGIAFWTSQVAQPGYDRADLLLAFAGSAENLAGSTFVETLEETAPGEWAFA